MTRTLKPFFLIIFYFVTFSTLAQTSKHDQNLVQIPIKLLFDGMRASDSSMVKKAFATGARLETITNNNNGVVSVKTTNLNDFFAIIAKSLPKELDEQIGDMEIKIDHEMATAWVPYSFHYKGHFSHQGVNSFVLIKRADGWKIWSIIDTRRK